MKANRKFLHGDDEAVSPVIAVILMVAITVVLAATVYVWVSGFGSNSNSSPAHTLALTSAGPLADDDDAVAANDYKAYTVASASPALTWADMKLTVGGTTFAYTAIATACTDPGDDADFADSTFVGCSGGANEAQTASVNAGDQLWIKCTADCDDEELLIVDTEANSIMVTLKVR